MTQTFEFRNELSDLILIQMVDSHSMKTINKELDLIRQLFSQDDFRLIICQVDDWNRDLSTWEAPPVFGKMSACIWIRTRTPGNLATRRLAISRLTN